MRRPMFCVGDLVRWEYDNWTRVFKVTAVHSDKLTVAYWVKNDEYGIQGAAKEDDLKGLMAFSSWDEERI